MVNPKGDHCQVRSGQVRSGHSVYRAHSVQAVVAHACHGYQPSPVPVWDRKKKGVGSKGGPPALAGTKEYEQSDRESIASGGCFEVLWNLECPVGLRQKRNICTL